MTFAAFILLVKNHWRIALTVLGLVIVLGWASLHYLCGESRREKNIDDRTGQIVAGNTGVNVAANDANVAGNVANNAVNKAVNAEVQANKIRNSNNKNVPLSNAMKHLCEAYPETEGCPK
jgi:hypothetical protein